MTTATLPTPGQRPQWQCSNCHRIWALTEGQGICPCCGKPAHRKLIEWSKPRPIKIRPPRRKKQAVTGDGYDGLTGRWRTYYLIASCYARRAMPQDREDLLHDILLTIARAEEGHDPFT
ncbi:MAG: endonuclease Q family protein, partial [Dehalococcoidales bacterium]|nr:endonuclease Q family protein [Dehalococcoidales bacterium]